MRNFIKLLKQNSLRGVETRRRLKNLVPLGVVMMILLAFFTADICASVQSASDGNGVALTKVCTYAATPLLLTLPSSLKSKLTQTEQEGLQAILEALDKEYEKRLEGTLSEEKFAKLAESAIDDYLKTYEIPKEKLKSVNDRLDEIGITVKDIAEGNSLSSRKLFSEEFSKFLKSDKMKSFKKRDINGIEFTIKAATPFIDLPIDPDTNRPIYDLTRTYVDPRIYEAARPEPFLYDLLYKGRTDVTNFSWITKINRQGGSAFIHAGQLKPLMSWSWQENSAQPKKVAVRVKISAEMLEDISFLESEARRTMAQDLKEVRDVKLLSGNGVADEPLGIINSAVPYAGTNLDGTIKHVNNADAIVAGMLQMRLLNYVPNVLIWNPSDATALKVEKAYGHYISQEIMPLISSLRKIETVEIPQDTFILIDTRKYYVYAKNDISIKLGWGIGTDSQTNDIVSDFESNMVTMICEQRLFNFWHAVDEGAMLSDAFSIVKTALESPDDDDNP